MATAAVGRSVPTVLPVACTLTLADAPEAVAPIAALSGVTAGVR